MHLPTLHNVSRAASAAHAGLQKISTGTRIPTAKHDAAGLAVATALETRSGGHRAALRAINTGMSTLQVAEGAATGAVDALQRMRELAVAASSGTASPAARQSMQDEFAQLQQSLDDTAARATFAGRPVADGTAGTIEVQAGPDGGDLIEAELPDLTSGGLGVGALDLSSPGAAQAALDAIDGALEQAGGARSALGAAHGRLSAAAELGEGSAIAQDAGAATILDADMAMELSQAAGAKLRQDAALAALVQGRGLARGAVAGLL
jgi:flagellin